MAGVTLFDPTGETLLIERLSPLLYGEPVAIQVTDPKQRIKKRIGKPALIIVPGKKLGNEEGLVVALQGFGCELLMLNDLNTMPLIRIGLTARASKLLVHSLQVLYSGNTN